MFCIIAGSEEQARACAQIKKLDRDEWVPIMGEQAVRGRNFKGDTVLLFGTYRDRHMFEWREWVVQAKRQGAVVEEVIDGRMC